MTSGADLMTLLTSHGIGLLIPLAIIEGPIVTVIAAWLASLGLLDLRQVIVVVIIADLAGDGLLYLLGRFGLGLIPPALQKRLGVSQRRLVRLVRAFRNKGVKLLILGKLTHAAGFAILIAAGAARMPFAAFMGANLAATVPKSLVLVGLGYAFGAAYSQISNGIYWASLAILALGLVIFLTRKALIRNFP
jgi:membrane-associated protein